jgi:hypothetical protein
VFYHPDTVKQMTLNHLCQVLHEILHTYNMALAEAIEEAQADMPPPGTTLH